MPKLKQDRKTKYFSNYLEINNEKIEINNNQNKGVYLEIINRLIQQLDISYSLHKRVLVVRIDLHLEQYTPKNEVISKFINQIKQWISRNYKMKNIGYGWVRELEKAKSQHYHLVLFLDGNRIRYPNKLLRKIKEVWAKNGHVPTIKHPYYFINKKNYKDERNKVINRISYLAKIRGKRYRAPQTKDYQTSRLSL